LALQSKNVDATGHFNRAPHWCWIPLRVLLATLLLTLICFAISMLVAIIGTVAGSFMRHTLLDLTFTYRYVGFPVALTVSAITLICMTFVEVRHYRQARALAKIEQAN